MRLYALLRKYGAIKLHAAELRHHRGKSDGVSSMRNYHVTVYTTGSIGISLGTGLVRGANATM
jgi:transketolase N-terminal domain/subunit